jgi:hypothetical protein
MIDVAFTVFLCFVCFVGGATVGILTERHDKEIDDDNVR